MYDDDPYGFGPADVKASVKMVTNEPSHDDVSYGFSPAEVETPVIFSVNENTHESSSEEFFDCKTISDSDENYCKDGKVSKRVPIKRRWILSSESEFDIVDSLKTSRKSKDLSKYDIPLETLVKAVFYSKAKDS